jgi:cytochrome b561
MADVDALWSEASVERGHRYDRLSMTFHWATLGLLIVLFASGWILQLVNDDITAEMLLLTHRSTGILVLTITLARLVWKATAANAPHLLAGLPLLQRLLARASQYTLYLLLAVQPVTGLIQSIARGEPFALFGLTVPALMARNERLADLFDSIHMKASFVLLAVIGLHTCAALFHGIVRRDGVLSSMLPEKAQTFR